MQQANININQNIAELKGELLFSSVMQVRQQGLNFIQQQDAVVFNFAAVTKADSAAIALLLDWYRAALESKKTIQFVNLPAAMMSLIKVSNLTDVLKGCV